MQRTEKLHQTCYKMQQVPPYLPAICKSQTNKPNVSEIIKQFTGEQRYCHAVSVTFPLNSFNTRLRCQPSETWRPTDWYADTKVSWCVWQASPRGVPSATIYTTAGTKCLETYERRCENLRPSKCKETWTRDTDSRTSSESECSRTCRVDWPCSNTASCMLQGLLVDVVSNAALTNNTTILRDVRGSGVLPVSRYSLSSQNPHLNTQSKG